MKFISLYIKDFICYDHAFINFTEFSSALIVGMKENNDMVSNGVGKTTIFKAIEYVLFNQSDCPLERLIRDDADTCQVVLDFSIGDQVYRIARTRTKKGSTDLTLLQRNGQDGSLEEVYHTLKLNQEIPLLGKKLTDKYWKDLSGSRAGDTEKDLAKLIKINYKAFVSTVHFPQNDMTGLPTVTPEKRKGILKDALDLLVYTKLEKIAKDKSNILSKDIEKYKLLINNLGSPNEDVITLLSNLDALNLILLDKNNDLIAANNEQLVIIHNLNELINIHSNLEKNFASLLLKEKSILIEKSKLEASIKEYQIKKTNINKIARELIEEIKNLKDDQSKLVMFDYSQIDIINNNINTIKEQISKHNSDIANWLERYEELKVPMPDDAVCKHCRQNMSELHKKECKAQLDKDLILYQSNIKKSKSTIADLSAAMLLNKQTVNNIISSKLQLDNVNTSIISKNKEMQDKKALYDEYCSLYERYNKDYQDKVEELNLIKIELDSSSIDDAKNIQLQIVAEKKNNTNALSTIENINNCINKYGNDAAVLKHTIDLKRKDIVKKDDMSKLLIDTDNKLKIYPSVIQAFSSLGIPNLIIQNVLDDLQIEANNLLSQLKPGLQLSFVIEKTKVDGDQADTLDINYHINGRERYYKQLSGAMQLAVSFSLKLGLSFLLQKMIGTDIKILLLDEVDQSLDKASVDAFTDIVKFFQKDFTILIITHNDRLKDKFMHNILVSQDINMVSQARVVSSN